MAHILTLIASKNIQITNDILDIVKNYSYFEDINWLSDGKALDIFFQTDDICSKFQKLQESLLNLKIDTILQAENESRKKKLLLADMDGTLIEEECLDEIADKIGIKEQVANITKRAMAGEIDFNTSLTERISLLKGIDKDILEEVRQMLTIRSGAYELSQTMRANNATCILVSGGFELFANFVVKKIGFLKGYSNILDINDNKITGKIIPPIVNETRKKEILELEVKKLGLSRQQVVAIGDGANDIEMLKIAGLGIAFHASDKTENLTYHKIKYADLKSILYVQGYSDADIAKASSI